MQPFQNYIVVIRDFACWTIAVRDYLNYDLEPETITESDYAAKRTISRMAKDYEAKLSSNSRELLELYNLL